MTIKRNEKMIRSMTGVDLKTREDEDNDLKIEGYFAVFDSETTLFPGAIEEIAQGAFDKTLGNDIRALINHDTSLVLGRNKSNTLELRVDSHGLWGSIRINPKDSDAMNLYERVRRGDVDQCSFGFNIVEETERWLDDGNVKWTIEQVDLHEVSVVTFPAYDATSVSARHKDIEVLKQRRMDARKSKLKERINHVVKTTNVE